MACLWAVAITGCGKPGVVGLHPDYPPVVRNSLSLFADFVEVDTLTPTFRWRPLTIAPVDPAIHQESAHIDHVTYEIRIWRTIASDDGKLVYARELLTANEHQLEKPLDPGTRYYWSVRANFEIGGHRRTTEWTLTGYMLRNEAVPNDSCPRFKTTLKGREK
jgi:hypothetical protein